VQVTLAIVLLVGAGLMMRTLFALQSIDLGFDPKQVLVGRFALPQGQSQTPAERVRFVQQVVPKIGAVPGVVAVSPSSGFPVQGGQTSPVVIPGVTSADPLVSRLEFVGESYFRAIGLPLIRGRLLSATDVESARRIAVVNRAFAREFLGDDDPVGRTIRVAAIDRAAGATQGAPLEIIGVVGDSRNAGLQNVVRPQVFLPYTAGGVPGAIVIRTSGDPLAVVHHVRQQIWTVDPTVALMNAMPLEEVLHRDALAAPRFGVGLMGTFAGVGLILAAVGVFSVMAYTVSLQTHDIGIRMALGAEPSGVMRMVLVKGLRPIVAGVVIGLAAAYGLSRFMASHIYGVTATDPWTFAGVAMVLMAVGLVACLLPARRATKVDPLIALRSE
jgi:putative ABC transport system permease protein